MKITENEDGSITVAIVKGAHADEVYDPADGLLYVTETFPAGSKVSVKVPKPKVVEGESDEAPKDDAEG